MLAQTAGREGLLQQRTCHGLAAGLSSVPGDLALSRTLPEKPVQSLGCVVTCNSGLQFKELRAVDPTLIDATKANAGKQLF